MKHVEPATNAWAERTDAALKQLGFGPTAVAAEDVFAHAPVRNIQSENAKRLVLQKARLHGPLEME